MTNTHIDKEAKQATAPEVLERYIMDSCTAKNEQEWWAHHTIRKLRERTDELEGALRGVINVADRKTNEFDRARALLTPLPAEGESSPKPEGLKWGCRWELMQRGGHYLVSPSGSHRLVCASKPYVWRPIDPEGYLGTGKDECVGALNDPSTPPPPDWQPHSSVTSASTSHDNAEKVGYVCNKCDGKGKVITSNHRGGVVHEGCNYFGAVIRPQSKPEAGEQRVFAIDKTINLAWDRNELQERLKSALDGAERYRTYAGLLEQWFIACGRPIPAKMPPAPTSQPAEPKVLPWPEDLTTLIGKRITLRAKDGSYKETIVVKRIDNYYIYAECRYSKGFTTINNVLLSVEEVHLPQPSEQAKGAEILVSTWMEYCERLMHEPDRLELVARIQNFIESERAQHKAEMEAVKKEMSR